MPNSPASPSSRISGGLYNDLLAGILMGEYPQNSALPPETRLAQDYGVSRTVVRSALERLKTSGVVESRQGSGTVVANHDPKKIAKLNRNEQFPELKDCSACRLAIEPAVAATVAAHLTTAAKTFLEEQRTLMTSAMISSDYDRWVQDAYFHTQLAECSGNAFFRDFMRQLRPHMLFAMNISKTLNTAAQQEHVDHSRLEHLEIIEAVLDQDPQAARSAMQLHLELGTNRIFREQEDLLLTD